MKIVHGLDGDPTLPVVTTQGAGVSNEELAEHLSSLVGVNNPFYAFDTMPEAIEGNIAWNPEGAPLCKPQGAKNLETIQAMLDDAALQALPNASVFAAG